MKIGESLPPKNIEVKISPRLPARALDVGGVNEVVISEGANQASVDGRSQVRGEVALAPYSSFAVHYPLTAAAMLEEGDVQLLDAPQETQREGRTIGTLAEGEVENIPNYSALENCLNDVAQLVDKFENTVLIDNEFMELRKQLEGPLIQQYMKLSPEFRTGALELAAKLRNVENKGKWDDTVLTPETLEPYLPLLFQYIYDASIVQSKIDEEDIHLSPNSLTESIFLRYVDRFRDLVAAGTISVAQAKNLYIYALDPQMSSRELFVATWQSQEHFQEEDNDFLMQSAILWNACSRMSPEVIKEMLKTMNEDVYIKRWGLKGEILWDWQNSMQAHVPYADRKSYIEQNVECLRELKKEDPEYTEFLDLYLGIRCYGRYSPEFLRGQRDMLLAKDRGLLLTSIEDNNGSFYHHQEVLDEFDQEQKADGVHMAPMEANSLYDALKKMIYLRQTIENKLKDHGGFAPFKYLMLRTHGSEEDLALGPPGKWRGEPLAREFMLRNDGDERRHGDRIRRFWKAFFDPNGSLILTGCSAGEDGGIAERLSRILPGVTIVASEGISYLEHIAYNHGKVQASFVGHPTWTATQTDEEGVESVVYYLGGVRIDPDAKNLIN